MKITADNLDAKRAYFALYYGQRILTERGLKMEKAKDAPRKESIASLLTYGTDGVFKDFVLILRSMNSVTQEEIDEYTSYSSLFDIIDWQRSKGFATPWMGLSVEDIVKFGWIKI